MGDGRKPDWPPVSDTRLFAGVTMMGGFMGLFMSVAHEVFPFTHQVPLGLGWAAASGLVYGILGSMASGGMAWLILGRVELRIMLATGPTVAQAARTGISGKGLIASIIVASITSLFVSLLLRMAGDAGIRKPESPAAESPSSLADPEIDTRRA